MSPDKRLVGSLKMDDQARSMLKNISIKGTETRSRESSLNRFARKQQENQNRRIFSPKKAESSKRSERSADSNKKSQRSKQSKFSKRSGISGLSGTSGLQSLNSLGNVASLLQTKNKLQNFKKLVGS